jgi:hypothetical protein
VLLVSVPYAFKAQEAETLGGLPASAFVLAASEHATSSGASSSNSLSTGGVRMKDSVGRYTLGQGTPGFIPLWINPVLLGSSTIYQTGGNVGIGTTTPHAKLDVNGGINTSGSFTGSGAGLTGIQFSQLSGTLGSAQFTGTYGSAVTLSNTANVYYGNGSNLTGVVAGPGSPYYIQNGTSQQTGANFNVDGNGTVGDTLSANVVNSATTYQIGESDVLSIGPSEDDVFLGVDAGSNNTSGVGNIYLGNPGVAGDNNTIRIGTDGTGPGQQNAAYIAGIADYHIPYGDDNAYFVAVDTANGNQLGVMNHLPGDLAHSPSYQSTQALTKIIETQQQQLQQQQTQIEEMRQRLSRLEALIEQQPARN